MQADAPNTKPVNATAQESDKLPIEKPTAIKPARPNAGIGKGPGSNNKADAENTTEADLVFNEDLNSSNDG